LHRLTSETACRVWVGPPVRGLILPRYSCELYGMNALNLRRHAVAVEPLLHITEHHVRVQP
jgi:hypothetical protein